MPAQHSDVYQPLAMDDGIVYQPNPKYISYILLKKYVFNLKTFLSFILFNMIY